jgi:hypothetical protein
MIKDIQPPIVENIAVAIVREQNAEGETEWNVYLINLKNEIIEGVLVSSTGYGIYNEEDVKTSTLRHFLGAVPANSFKKIEPIVESLFGINNEYWVSFFLKNKMYDKKFIFLAETINDEYFTTVPILNKKGVLIK